MISRRRFLEATGATTIAGALAARAESAPQRKRLAIVTTVWRYLSHAQHMGDRFLVGYPHEGRWHSPQMEVVSLFVDQRPEDDQAAQRAEEFGFQIHATIADALRRGGKALGVDAVLVIGEHGNYQTNAKGQIEYPRYQFFEEIVKVFREEGRVVPVFNDKHLSYRFDHARQMVEWSKELNFPLMAGSSLPVTYRLPSIEMPYGCHVEDALMIGVGSSDAMDFHALEAMQCMLERRSGGERGVRSVQLIDGEAVWQAGDEGRWSWNLLESALSRSNQLEGLSRSEAKPQDLVHSGALQSLAKRPAAYFIEYRDGLKATLLMLNGAVSDFTFAAKVRGQDEPISTLFYLPPTPNVTYSAELMHRVQEMFLTGNLAYPVQRTLLVSGMLEDCLNSRAQGGIRLNTPHLDVPYQVSQESSFAQS